VLNKNKYITDNLNLILLFNLRAYRYYQYMDKDTSRRRSTHSYLTLEKKKEVCYLVGCLTDYLDAKQYNSQIICGKIVVPVKE
jgi:hypothetical protein